MFDEWPVKSRKRGLRVDHTAREGSNIRNVGKMIQKN
jgi:hypothetical protein